MKKIISICICAAVMVGGFFTYKAMASEPDEIEVQACNLYDGDTNADEPKGKIKAEEVKSELVTGEYIGQIDNNSIEVKINGESTSLYFSPEISDTFNTKNLKLKDKVSISFYNNDQGQNILTAIEKE